MAQTADVLVIGGGPVGTYLAQLLGNTGLDVIVVESREQKAMGTEIGYIHFDCRYYLQLNIPRPSIESGICIRTFDTLWQVPLDESRKFPVDYPTDMLNYPLFIQHLQDWALRTEKVQYYFNSPCEEIICENNTVVGAVIRGHGEVRASIVVDATGRHAFVRNNLPPSMGIPPLHTRPGRMFTVYMEEWECEGKFPKGSNTYVCFKGFANQLREKTTLVGASTLQGREGSREMHRRVVAHHLSGINYKVINTFCSEVPYDFPPSTLVGNGFISVGDSAFLNKPFNGEGIGSGMETSRIAAEVIIDAMRSGNFSRSGLWDYNTRYFNGQGADFALIRGAGETLVELSVKEFDWMYQAGFLSAEDMVDTWTKYRVQKDVGSILQIASKGIRNPKVFSAIGQGLLLGAKISYLFKKYPGDPSAYSNWLKKWDKIQKKLM